MSLRSLALTGLVAALVGACSTQGRGGRDDGRPAAPKQSCTGSPTVDGSRRPCLDPPYAPPPGATALADGTPFVRDEGGRRFTFQLAGDTDASPEELSALIQRLRERGGSLTFLSYGLYCGSRDSRRACLHLRVDLCAVKIDELAGELLAAIAEDPILPRPRAELAISLGGLLEPRCRLDQGGCMPVPLNEGGPRYNPFAKRGPRFHLGGVRGGSCDHDGECMLAGCGNRCHHWTCPGANEAGTCEGYSFAKPVYCGCVRGECGFFSQ